MGWGGGDYKKVVERRFQGYRSFLYFDYVDGYINNIYVFKF